MHQWRQLSGLHLVDTSCAVLASSTGTYFNTPAAWGCGAWGCGAWGCGAWGYGAWGCGAWGRGAWGCGAWGCGAPEPRLRPSVDSHSSSSSWMSSLSCPNPCSIQLGVRLHVIRASQQPVAGSGSLFFWVYLFTVWVATPIGEPDVTHRTCWPESTGEYTGQTVNLSSKKCADSCSAMRCSALS